MHELVRSTRCAGSFNVSVENLLRGRAPLSPQAEQLKVFVQQEAGLACVACLPDSFPCATLPINSVNAAAIFALLVAQLFRRCIPAGAFHFSAGAFLVG